MLIYHVLTPIILACILNIYIYSRGWNSKGNIKNNKLPPGYIIAIVWIIILGLLGYVHYIVYPSYASWVLVAAILYCLAYPFLTAGLKQEKAGIYNALSLVIAVVVFYNVYIKNSNVTLFVLPFLLWTTYVNVVTNI